MRLERSKEFSASLGSGLGAAQNGPEVYFPGGVAYFVFDGTLTSGAIQVLRPDGSTWQTAPNGALTNTDGLALTLPSGRLRLSVTTGSGVSGEVRLANGME